MGDKKAEPEKSPEEQALEQHVDEMMSLERDRGTDVSKLAEDFNKKLMGEDSVKGEISVQSGPPELPGKSKQAAGDDAEPEPEPEPGPESEPESEAEAESEAAAESEPEPEPEPEVPAVNRPAKPADEFDDKATDKAVDEIMAEESDTLLAVQDVRTERKKAAANPPGKSFKQRLNDLLHSKWTKIFIIVLVVVYFALPATRYTLLGLIIKKDVTVSVVDSKTNSPVSSAQIVASGDSAKTDASGQAHLHLGLGQRTITVTKKYYVDAAQQYFVGLGSGQTTTVKLVATGRLVPVTVTNTITGKPLGGVEIKAQGTSAKTDKQGTAFVALPVKDATYAATLSLSGYNQSQVTVTVTDKTVKANTFAMVPAGHVYFLSNLSGSLDVVKANLDGSNRKVVLQGSGHEEPSKSSLLASRDWRYLVLKARRDSDYATLYLIDTSSDKITEFDTTNADFTLIGWYNHDFVYSLDKNSVNYWQSGRQVLKSYDADHQQLNQLDQNQAEGDGSSYAYQYFVNFYILNGVVSYNTEWSSYKANGTDYDLSGKNYTIRAVQPNGQNKKDYQTFPAATTGFIQAALYAPQSVYYGIYDSGANKTSYYEFEELSVKPASIDQSTLDAPYPTYLLSPSGNKTFWTELRDGKNALFIGDDNAGNKKQIASLSDYSPYGWYSDSYLLVSKNSSELYIIPAGQSSQAPVKITDYYKPAQTYAGYGYGYGGL